MSSAMATPESNFRSRLDAAAETVGSNIMLCVGLDLSRSKVPERFGKNPSARMDWAHEIIEQTAGIAGFFKFNLGFWLQKDGGLEELSGAINYAKERAPHAIVIVDAKSGDIGTSSEEYATNLLDELGADAITLNPYLGAQALEPFFNRTDNAFVILCRTSNEGSGEFQDLAAADIDGYESIYIKAARHVDQDWRERYGDRFMLVVGATYPKDAKWVREVACNTPFLIPGIGRQGGDLEAIVRAVVGSEKDRHVINVSSGIANAENPGEEGARIFKQIRSAYQAALSDLSSSK